MKLKRRNFCFLICGTAIATAACGIKPSAGGNSISTTGQIDPSKITPISAEEAMRLLKVAKDSKTPRVPLKEEIRVALETQAQAILPRIQVEKEVHAEWDGNKVAPLTVRLRYPKGVKNGQRVTATFLYQEARFVGTLIAESGSGQISLFLNEVIPLEIWVSLTSEFAPDTGTLTRQTITKSGLSHWTVPCPDGTCTKVYILVKNTYAI